MLSENRVAVTMSYNYIVMKIYNAAMGSLSAVKHPVSSAMTSSTVTMAAFRYAEECWNIAEGTLGVAEGSVRAAESS